MVGGDVLDAPFYNNILKIINPNFVGADSISARVGANLS